MEASASTAALTLSGAAIAGIVSKSLARSLQIPGIVLLLAVGILLGPDVADLIQPNTLGSALPEVVGFAVAVILFEGGMRLKLSRFREQHKAIRRLVTYGAFTTAIGGHGASSEMLHREGGHLLFGSEYNVDRWVVSLGEGSGTMQSLIAGASPALPHERVHSRLAIPLVHRRGRTIRPVADDLVLKAGDVVYLRSTRPASARPWPAFAN